MPSISRNGSRRYAAIALAALFGAVLSEPAPAAARAQHQEQPSCNPSYEYCQIYYTYYTSSARTTVTGHAYKDCDGLYTLQDGYETNYLSYEAFPCPS